MRISDWSSDVCSSDLLAIRLIRDDGAEADETQLHAGVGPLKAKRPLDRTDNLAADNGIERAGSLRRQSLRVDTQTFECEILRDARTALVVDDLEKIALDAAISRRIDRKSTSLNSSH